MSNALFEAKSRVVVLAKSRVKSRTIRVPFPSVTMASGPSTDADKIQFPDLVIGDSRRRFYVGAADPIYRIRNGSDWTKFDYLEESFRMDASTWEISARYDGFIETFNYTSNHWNNDPYFHYDTLPFGPGKIKTTAGVGWAYARDAAPTTLLEYSLICWKDYYAYRLPAAEGPPHYYDVMFDVARIYGPARGLVFQYSGLAYRNGGGPDSAREIVIPHGAYYVLQATGDSIPLIPYPVSQVPYRARAQFIPEKTFADYPQYFSASKDATDINIDSRPI